jgi:uncharacterized protein
LKLDNEFTVGVPVSTAWDVLTDLELIAPCMPGAALTGVNDGVYTGKVKIKVGPITAEYAGTAQFTEKDDASHRAVIDARGRDSRGNGNANAVISAQLRADGDRTVVNVTTDLTIAGRIAQFGSGMIKEVSAKLLGQFVTCLEGRLGGDTPGPAGADDQAVPAVETTSARSDGTSGAAATVSVAGAGSAAGAIAAAGDVPPGATVSPAGTVPPAATVSPAGTVPPAAPFSAADSGPAEAGFTAESAVPAFASAAGAVTVPAAADGVAAEPEPIDLMSLAGDAIYKRLVPVLMGLVVLGLVIYLIARW